MKNTTYYTSRKAWPAPLGQFDDDDLGWVVLKETGLKGSKELGYKAQS